MPSIEANNDSVFYLNLRMASLMQILFSATFSFLGCGQSSCNNIIIFVIGNTN